MACGQAADAIPGLERTPHIFSHTPLIHPGIEVHETSGLPRRIRAGHPNRKGVTRYGRFDPPCLHAVECISLPLGCHDNNKLGRYRAGPARGEGLRCQSRFWVPGNSRLPVELSINACCFPGNPTGEFISFFRACKNLPVHKHHGSPMAITDLQIPLGACHGSRTGGTRALLVQGYQPNCRFCLIQAPGYPAREDSRAEWRSSPPSLPSIIPAVARYGVARRVLGASSSRVEHRKGGTFQSSVLPRRRAKRWP